MTKTLKVKVGAFTCIPNQGFKILSTAEAFVGKTELALEQKEKFKNDLHDEMELGDLVNLPGENTKQLEKQQELPGENDPII